MCFLKLYYKYSNKFDITKIILYFFSLYKIGTGIVGVGVGVILGVTDGNGNETFSVTVNGNSLPGVTTKSKSLKKTCVVKLS